MKYFRRSSRLKQRKPQQPSWRSYQEEKWGATVRKQKKRRLLKYGVSFFFLVVVIYGITGAPGDSAVHQEPPPQPTTSLPMPIIDDGPMIDKLEVQALLDSNRFVNLRERRFDFGFDGRRFRIDTSLDPGLQNYILDHLQKDTSRYIGIVVMDPRTGRLLVMAGYDRNDPSHNPCTDSIFPAASIFKIVTAAGAVETCGLGARSTLTYPGHKYTLYKKQVENKRSRNGNRITLRDSFAQSVNPVFGILGVHYLKKNGLEKFARAFGFNRSINFELPVTPSTISLSDDPYQWAEVASGFNRTTTISPLHGAIMVSAIVANEGRLIEPSIVDRITDENGHLLYRQSLVPMNRAVSPEVAGTIKRIMRETVRSGTGRKEFSGSRDDPVLSRLRIGGKTGTINSRAHDYRRFDWFVGYAEEQDGPEKIVFSVVVAHEKFIGIKAKQYARMIITRHFEKYFSSSVVADVEETKQKG